MPVGAYVWDPFDSLSSVCSFTQENVAFGSTIVDGARTVSNPDMKIIATELNQPLPTAHSTVTPNLTFFHIRGIA